MANNSDRYSKHELIAGKDSWYKVLGYRILLLGVDVFSIAAVFAGCSTWMLYKFYSELNFLVTNQAKSTVIIAYLALGMLQLSAWILAFVYYCMRKYTPPIVNAIANRISGNAKDFAITDTTKETDNEQNIVLEMKEPPKPVEPQGWSSIIKKAEKAIEDHI